jgi:hypothetical protein
MSDVVRPKPEQTVALTELKRAAQAKVMLGELYRLVEAIDRRVPQLQRIGEAQIAHDAAELRLRAVNLIRRIEGETPSE